MFLGKNKLETSFPRPFVPTGIPGPTSQNVELLVVQVGGQPFGLLLKQIFNIARPENDKVSLTGLDGSTGSYSEIIFQGQVLRVVDLARKLSLKPVEALSTPDILISGRFDAGGNIRDTFGIIVDDVIGVWQVALGNLRLLDEWVCRKRLGKLIWGVGLVERAKFGGANLAGKVEPTSQFNDLMSETGLLASSTRPDRIGPEGVRWVESGRQAMAHQQNTVEVPLMLLDLEVLRADLYRY